MTPEFQQLLEATIQHLSDLQAQGARFVSVSPEVLGSLSKVPPSPVVAPGRSSRSPASVVAEAASPIAPHAATVPRAVEADLAPSSAAAPSARSGNLTTEARAAAWAELRQRALACVKCPHLVRARRQVVFGVGSATAELMFVGEAPGMDEDAQGEPFVGKAGQLLTKIIQAMNLSREQVYIGNILKCRPDTPGQSYGNRKPTAEEMETCIPWLLEQIDLLQPRVLVALGATAVEGLLGRCPSITRLRGQWQTFRNIPMMPTFHPSFLLRPENADKKRLVWEDMLVVMERLGLPITEKQRGYFRSKTS